MATLPWSAEAAVTVKIGTASCGGRGWISAGAASLKKKTSAKVAVSATEGGASLTSAAVVGAVLGDGGGVGDRGRRVVDLGDGDGHRRSRAVRVGGACGRAVVGDGVADGVGAVVVGRRRVSEGPVGVDGDAAVERRGGGDA